MSFQNHTDFLTYYEAAHRNQANRTLHHIAHVLGPIGGFLLLWSPVHGLSLILVSFLMSWAGHYLFERNTPAFFDRTKRSGDGGGGGGLEADLVQKSRVALGGVLWSAACWLRLFNRGPLATGRVL